MRKETARSLPSANFDMGHALSIYSLLDQLQNRFKEILVLLKKPSSFSRLRGEADFKNASQTIEGVTLDDNRFCMAFHAS